MTNIPKILFLYVINRNNEWDALHSSFLKARVFNTHETPWFQPALFLVWGCTLRGLRQQLQLLEETDLQQPPPVVFFLSLFSQHFLPEEWALARARSRSGQLAPRFSARPPNAPQRRESRLGPRRAGREASVVLAPARLLPVWNFFEVFCFILKIHGDFTFYSKTYPCLFEYWKCFGLLGVSEKSKLGVFPL